MRSRSFFAVLTSAVLLAVAAFSSSRTHAQQGAAACLHDGTETEANRARRFSAVTFARVINTAEAQVRTRERYHPLASLPVGQPGANRFEVHLLTHGDSYQFAIKDTLDPCMFAFVSEQTGIILQARVIQ